MRKPIEIFPTVQGQTWSGEVLKLLMEYIQVERNRNDVNSVWYPYRNDSKFDRVSDGFRRLVSTMAFDGRLHKRIHLLANKEDDEPTWDILETYKNVAIWNNRDFIYEPRLVAA